MDADTLSALRHSIQKWEMIIAGVGGDDADLNCALCRKFFNDPDFAKIALSRRAPDSRDAMFALPTATGCAVFYRMPAA
jgi:hypothetical protein